VTGLDERGGLVGAFSFTRTRNEISCYFSDYTIAGRLVNVIGAGS
jgi:hypothetical protein